MAMQELTPRFPGDVPPPPPRTRLERRPQLPAWGVRARVLKSLAVVLGVMHVGCVGSTGPGERGSDDAPATETAHAPLDASGLDASLIGPEGGLPDASADAGFVTPCFETPTGAQPLPMASGPVEVQLGARDATTGTGFVAFDSRCGIPIGGEGQAGLTARFALRVRSERTLDRAYVALTLVNFADPAREPAPNNGQGVVRALNCRADGWCYLVPLLVEISHLNDPAELAGTVVTFGIRVAAAADEALFGTLHGWGEFVPEHEEQAQEE